MYSLIRTLWLISSLLARVDSLTDEIGNDIDFTEHANGVPLIIHAQQYLKASSVFLINADDKSTMQSSTVVFRLSLEFSEKGVFSVYLDLSTAIKRYDELHLDRILRPLFVTILSTTEEITRFRIFLKSVKVESIWWLLIFSESAQSFCLEPKMTQFELTFDTEMMVKCHGDRNIREWYSYGNNITSGELATWDSVNGIQMVRRIDINERRNDLTGLTFRMAIVRKSPFISSENGSVGFFYMILNELRSMLHFKYEIMYAEDYFGSFNETSREWTGTIGRVARNEVDFGIAEFTMTKERLNVMKFTHPILLSPNYLYMKEPKISPLKLYQYFQVFTDSVWISWAVMFFISIVIILFIKCHAQSQFVSVSSVFEDILLIWGLFCQQSLPDFPRKSCLKLAYCSILLECMMIYYLYSACLFTYLAYNVPVKPFQNIDEFARDGSYKVLALQQSTDLETIQNEKDDTMKKLKDHMADNQDLPINSLEGFNKTCRIKKTAFFATRDIHHILNAWIPCRLVRIETGGFDSLSLIMTKRNQYKGIFDYQLRQFQSAGITSRMVDMFYKKKNEPPLQYTRVTIESVVIIFFILGLGFILSLGILGFELALHNGVFRKRNTRITKKEVDITKLMRESEMALRSLQRIMKQWQEITDSRDAQNPFD